MRVQVSCYRKLNFFKRIFPLLGAMFLEGSSIPFPGIVVVLGFGSLERPSFNHSLVVAFFMATTYTLASFIPYAIGRKLGIKVLSIFDKRKKIKASIDKSKEIVDKYGIFTIAISRFFGWGNKISYIAGVSKINCLSYGILTFIGIYIWSLIMVNIGKIFKGNTHLAIEMIKKYTLYMYIIVGVVVVIYFGILLIKYKLKNEDKKD